MRKLIAVAASTLLVSAFAAIADHDTAKKPLSPAQEIKYQGKGNKSITLNYSAPSVRGRKIMGELVPYGKVWRTGANAATTLTTQYDLMIGSLHVPAGKYSLYTIPGETEWTLIVNKQTGQWGTNYDQSQDLGRVKMKVAKTAAPVEQMLFAVNDKELSLSWENTRASVPVMLH
jgi:hypothetical protein